MVAVVDTFEDRVKRFQEATAYTLDGGSVTQRRDHTLRFILSVNKYPPCTTSQYTDPRTDPSLLSILF